MVGPGCICCRPAEIGGTASALRVILFVVQFILYFYLVSDNIIAV